MLVKALESAWPNAHQITTLRGMLVLLHGRGLWTSDGTAEGTRRIVPAGTDVSSLEPGSLESIGDLAFFTSCDGTQCQLWRTDGTDDGTFAVATLVERYDKDDGEPRFHTAVVQPAAANGTLFSSAQTATLCGPATCCGPVTGLSKGPDASHRLNASTSSVRRRWQR